MSTEPWSTQSKEVSPWVLIPDPMLGLLCTQCDPPCTPVPVLLPFAQVVGRIYKGMEMLDALAELETLPDDAPMSRVRIARCGPTNPQGIFNSLDDSLGRETAQQTAARLQQEAAEARNAIT